MSIFYPPTVKSQAVALRKQGKSLREISQLLGMAKSTASAWASDVWLDDHAKEILIQKAKFGHKNLVLARLAQEIARQNLKRKIRKFSFETVSSISYDKNINKLLCSLLYWAEGSKYSKSIRFTNSDPNMIRTFLFLFRRGFNIKEDKIHLLVHLHSYHKEGEIIEFWSNVAGIPAKQFYKSYKKSNTGKVKRENYKGCITIYYSNYEIALELMHTYNAYANSIP